MPVTISTATPLPAGSRGSAYSQTLAATGETSPYVWFVRDGYLPPGLALSSGGVLSGTPTGSGTYSFTVGVLAANNYPGQKDFTLEISVVSLAALATPFNQNNIRQFYYNKPVADWAKVTAKHTYQDEGASFNANNSNAPQIFEWEFRGLTAAEAAVFDAHYNAAKGELYDFPYVDKDQTYYSTGTRYLKYDGDHDGHKSWRKTRKITLIRYP